jgi:hypothetical protein
MKRKKTHNIKQQTIPQIDMLRYEKTMKYLNKLEIGKWYELPQGSLDFVKEIEMRLFLNEGINVIIIDNGIKIINK